MKTRKNWKTKFRISLFNKISRFSNYKVTWQLGHDQANVSLNASNTRRKCVYVKTRANNHSVRCMDKICWQIAFLVNKLKFMLSNYAHLAVRYWYWYERCTLSSFLENETQNETIYVFLSVFNHLLFVPLHNSVQVYNHFFKQILFSFLYVSNEINSSEWKELVAKIKYVHRICVFYLVSLTFTAEKKNNFHKLF